MLLFGAIGDLHGDFEALDRIMTRHAEAAFWVCPGDLASDAGEYPRPRAPLYWIKGNNEDFDFVAAQPHGSGTLPNLHYIRNGMAIEVAGLRFAGLGGTFAPTWYERSAAELRRLTSRDDRRRHFVHEEVEACAAIQGIDVFLTHEAPRPFPVGRVKDAGKTPLNQVLAAMRPRLHLFGHHHVYSAAVRQGVTSISLGKVSESYLLVNGKTLALQCLQT